MPRSTWIDCASSAGWVNARVGVIIGAIRFANRRNSTSVSAIRIDHTLHCRRLMVRGKSVSLNSSQTHEARFRMDASASWLSKLNDQQRLAATIERDRPVLIVAGAGTGKTNTLAHRVAHLIAAGTDPSRILLLTFTRRAAAEMTRRVENILASRDRKVSASAISSRVWGGTFHAMGHRLLRMHGASLGLGDNF